jgi:hypothetical protein
MADDDTAGDRAAADRIHDVLQADGAPRSDEISGGVVLTQWAIVTEWMDHDGQRFLTRMHQPDGTIWQAKGLWHEALNGTWPGSEES